MDLSLLIGRLSVAIMQAGMPLVQAYHMLGSNIFLNVAAADASGIEKWANEVLTPVHYLFAGQVAIEVDPVGHVYELRQRFTYEQHFALKTVASIAALPLSLLLGTFLKTLSYVSAVTRARHHFIAASGRVVSHRSTYQSLGMDLGDWQRAETLSPLALQRRDGDELRMSLEKQALREIIALLQKHDITFWADCGTLLGAYRYGGVIPWDGDIDIAVLATDFDNIKCALSALDPALYIVQDWSGRDRPKTYLKVYLKEARAFIDIYHCAIDPHNKTIATILSNEESIFLPESWKIRERRYLNPLAFEVVFPLKKALFDGIELPVPGRVKEYLQSKYGENLDPVYLYDEAVGQYVKDLSHPYWQRSYVY